MLGGPVFYSESPELSWGSCAPAYLLDDLGLLDHELIYFVAVSSQ